MMTIDVLPTWAARIGAPLPEAPIDGVDIWSYLAGDEVAGPAHETLYFYYKNNDLEAIRSGRWKLHLPHSYRSMNGRALGEGGIPGKYDYKVRTGLELYDLKEDIAESVDLAAEKPAVVEQLLKQVEAMRAELGDRLTKRTGSSRRPPGRIQ